MKYIGLDQVERECTGPYAFKIETRMVHGYESRRLHLEPSMKFEDDFHPIIAAMEVVASKPPFLREQDCPWILAYMDDMREYCDKFISKSTPDHCRQHLSLKDKVRQFALNNDVVSATRMMHVVDIINSILYFGNVYQHDYFCSDNDISWLDKKYYLSLMEHNKKEEFRDFRLDIDYDRQFKTLMTRNVYKGAQVMITIPEGEELSSENFGGKTMILNSGASFECTIVRFFKTDLCWANRGTFEFYPTMPKVTRDRLDEEPMFAVEMDMAKEFLDNLGWGATIHAFIPLHWVSHVYYEGQYLAVGERPTPQKTDEKLPVPMTTRDFDFFNI